MAPWSPADWDIFLRLFTVVFAPFFGSFLALFVHRWPQGLPVVHGRSRCEACGAVPQLRDLVPVLSWLLLRGRCRRCGAAIGFAPLAFELVMLAAGLSLALSSLPGSRALLLLLAGGSMLAIAVIDARHLLIPRSLALAVLALGVVDGALHAAPADAATGMPWARLLGAATGFAGMEAIRHAYRRLRGREGLGAGDSWLMAAIGAWTGARALGLVLLFAALAALVLTGLEAARRGRWPEAGDRLAFGPFLAAAGVAVVALRLVMRGGL